MAEKQTLIDTLPDKLGLAERFGKVILAEVIQLYPDIPETKVVFGRFPEPPGEIGR